MIPAHLRTTRLDRHIGRAVILSTLFALLAVLILVSFITLMDELGDVGKGDYRLGDALLYVLMVMPRRIYEVMPVAVLLGSLIGLGGLANHAELIAMRAAGVSVGRIVGSALKAGALMMLVVILTGEVIAPFTEQYAETMRAERITKQITLKSQYGFWARDGDSYVNIRRILPGARLEDIYIYELNPDGALRTVTHAAFAHYQQDHWLLRDIDQTELDGENVVARHMQEAAWASLLNPQLLSVVVVRPTMLPAWGLYRYIQFLQGNGQSATVYEVAFWGKIIMPLSTLVMVFLATPFVFGVLRSVGIGARVFAGALIGVAFFLLDRMFGHIALVYALDPLIAAAAPTMAALALAWLGFRRVH